MPSLTEVVCDELGRFPVARRCCRRAEIATVLRLSAAVGRRDGRLVVVADLDEVVAARRLHTLITAAFGYPVRLAARPAARAGAAGTAPGQRRRGGRGGAGPPGRPARRARPAGARAARGGHRRTGL